MAAGATGTPSNRFVVQSGPFLGNLAAVTGKQNALRFFAEKPARLLSVRHYAAGTAGGALSAPRLRIYVNGTVKGTATCPAGAVAAKRYTLSTIMTGPANAWWGIGVPTSGVALATSLPGGITFAAVFQHGHTV